MSTLAAGWKVTRTDSTVFAFTDHDQDRTVGGVTYKSAIGFVPSAIERGTELKSDNQIMRGIIDSVDITAADLRTGKWDGARVEIIEFNWLTQTKARDLLVGFLGGVELIDNQYSATLVSMEYELQKPIGRTIQLRCDADLGDTRCGYTLTSDSLTVTTVTSRLSFIDTALTAADSYYNGGKLVWLTGDNAGLTFDVKKYASATDTVDLYEPTPYAIQVGDTANIFRGCDKTFETCRDDFSNVDNFRGFNHLPGIKDLIGGNVT